MKTLLTVSALLLSGNLYAGIYSGFGDVGNSDIYRGNEDSSSLPTAVQPGIGDSYGSAVLKSGFADRASSDSNGSNDAYGSVLLDVGHSIDW
jgi:hypothetical protein